MTPPFSLSLAATDFGKMSKWYWMFQQFEPAGFSSCFFLSLPQSCSLSLALSVSLSATFIRVLLSEGHSINPNINNEWNGVGAPWWPPVLVWMCIHSLCECVGVWVHLCEKENIPDWWDVMTDSRALPSSSILSFRVLWLSTFSLKLWNTQRSSLVSRYVFLSI